MHEVLRERRALYDQGMNDAEISRQQGVSPSAIYFWRKRQGLAPNARTRAAHDSVTPMRKLLHELGWNAKRIAEFQGVSRDAVHDWLTRRGLHANNRRRRMSAEQCRQQLRELQQRVVRAVGHRLPFDIAADASAELMLAVIEGRVPLNQIEKHGRAFGNRALREYANPFTMKSLDDDLPDHEGLRPVDLLSDEGSSAWLEEMGATVH